MELVEELRKHAKIIIGVLTGNGITEFKILRATAKKYNGSDKVLYFPRRPGFLPGGGFSALKVTKIYASKYGINNFLYLIDREHFTTKMEIEKEIGEKFREIGVEIKHIQNFSIDDENVVHVKGMIGAHNFILWAAITGKEKCIEESIARLIEIKLKVEIKPTKNDITKILKKHNIDIEHLMASANVEQLKTSFPAVNLVLSNIECDNNA